MKMKNILKFAALFSFALLAFTGCEHPDTTEELPYYYYEPIAYLENVNTRVAVYHSPDGIVNQDITMPVTVGLSKAMTGACTVRVECTVEGEGFTTQNVALPNNGVVTIPAGERSASFTLSIGDWSFCSGVADARSYTISLKIVEASARISTNSNSVVYVLDKTRESYTSTAAPTEGSQVATDAYTVSYNVKADTWTPIEIGTSGRYSRYLYYSSYIGLQWDLGSTKTVTAVANVCYPYYTSYNTAVYTIMTSTDGQKWTTYDEGLDLAQSEPQYVSFYTPVEARYVRLLMRGVTAFSNGALIYAK